MKNKTAQHKWDNYMKKVSEKTMIRCKQHPKYRAVHRPNVNCDPCWKMYISKHPESGQWRELLLSLQKYGQNAIKELQ